MKMNFNRHKIAICISLASSIFLTGCMSDRYKNIVSQNDASVQVATKSFKEVIKPLPKMPVAVDSDAFYVEKVATKTKDDGLPPVFDKNLQLRIEPHSSLRDVTMTIARATNMRFSFAPDVQMEADKQLLQAGFKRETTLKGFLDQLTSIPNPALSWQYKDGQIELFRYSTKVFALNMPTTDVDFNGDATNKSRQSGTGSTGAAVSSGQSMSVSTKLRFWASVEKEIKQMLTPTTGNVVVSQATRSVTVTDTPQALNAVEAYIQHLNEVALRKVYINVEVMTIKDAKSDSGAINWDAIYSTVKNKYGVNIVSPTMSAAAPTGTGSVTLSLNPGSGNFQASKAIVNILSTMDRTASVKSVPQYTMSDVPAHSMVNHSVGYAASVVTAQPTVAGGSVTQTITPGTVTYGISVHSIPHVLSEDSLELEESIEISTLDGMPTFGSAASGQIQIPLTSATSFFPVTTMKSGQTLIIAGIEETNTDASQNGMGSAENALAVAATGNHVGTLEKSTVVVLLTPYLLPN